MGTGFTSQWYHRVTTQASGRMPFKPELEAQHPIQLAQGGAVNGREAATPVSPVASGYRSLNLSWTFWM